MGWFFRAVEVDGGSWVCRHGLTDFDTHVTLQAAVDHLQELARLKEPARLFVHRLDGTVEDRGAL